MKINGAKCKIISPSRESIVIDGQEVEHVEDFVFLGSVVPSSGADVKRRTALASSAFGRLKKAIWSKWSVSLQLKSRLYRALILPIATYASETLTLKSEDVRKLDVFERRCLRAILGITRFHKVKNEQVYKRLCMENTITDVIKKNACAGSATSLENQTVAWCLKHTEMTSITPGREADHRNDGQPKYEKILESPSRQPREEHQTGDRGEGLPGWRTRGVLEA